MGNKEDAKMLNTYSDTLQTKARHAHQILLDSGLEVNAENLKNQLSGNAEKTRYLMQIFEEHNPKNEIFDWEWL